MRNKAFLTAEHLLHVALVVVCVATGTWATRSGAVFTDSATNSPNPFSTASTFPPAQYTVLKSSNSMGTGIGSGAGTAFTNPQNAETDNALYATQNPTRRANTTTYWAIPPFTAMDIPANATAITVTCTVQYKVNSNLAWTLSQNLYNGNTLVGSNQAAVAANNTTDTDRNCGSATITRANLLAGTFQVATVSYFDDSATGTISFDHIYVKATFTA